MSPTLPGNLLPDRTELLGDAVRALGPLCSQATRHLPRVFSWTATDLLGDGVSGRLLVEEGTELAALAQWAEFLGGEIRTETSFDDPARLDAWVEVDRDGVRIDVRTSIPAPEEIL